MILKYLISFLLLILLNGIGAENSASVPEWAKEAVWYQIFPERFRNGDPGNDPAPGDLRGSWPHLQPANWQVHPWTSEWYKLQPWEKETGEDFYINAGLRRYGGDLQGVLDMLDYLQKLGITAIYFNPLFESPSLHKYDATLFHHIDDNFGPNPEKDREIRRLENPADPETWRWTTADSLFLNLIAECHRCNIRVIIDGVFNHVGYTFWAFEDVLQNQQNSNYKDWFIIHRWDNPTTPENEFEYEGWAGVRELPEIREDENGLVDGPRQHVHAVVKRWMDPNGDGDPSDGIDGWRLDVAEKVNIDFWKEFLKWVKEINSEAYITGEIWWEDWEENKMINAAPWLQGDVFDGVMNYRWARAVKKWVIESESPITAQAFVDSFQTLQNQYPQDNLYVLQNLMDSHDIDRISSQIVNPNRWFDHRANPAQNPDYQVRRPTAEERQKQKLIVGMQATFPGAPMFYYGDEAGMWGADDPDCRKPMVWPDMQYEPETTHPFGKPRPVDSVFFDNDLFSWYRKMIAIRKENPALALGSIEFFIPAEQNSVLGYNRKLDNNNVFVLLNKSSQTVKFQFPVTLIPENKQLFSDLVTGKNFEIKKELSFFSLGPYQIAILK